MVVLCDVDGTAGSPSTGPLSDNWGAISVYYTLAPTRLEAPSHRGSRQGIGGSGAAIRIVSPQRLCPGFTTARKAGGLLTVAQTLLTNQVATRAWVAAKPALEAAPLDLWAQQAFASSGRCPLSMRRDASPRGFRRAWRSFIPSLKLLRLRRYRRGSCSGIRNIFSAATSRFRRIPR